MIISVGSVKNPSLDYVLNKRPETSKIIAGNIKDFNNEIKLVKKNKRVKNRAYTLLVSFPTKSLPKVVKDYVLGKLKRELLTKRGFKQDNWIVVEHKDTNNLHFHIQIPNRNQIPSTKTKKPKNNSLRCFYNHRTHLNILQNIQKGIIKTLNMFLKTKSAKMKQREKNKSIFQRTKFKVHQKVVYKHILERNEDDLLDLNRKELLLPIPNKSEAQISDLSTKTINKSDITPKIEKSAENELFEPSQTEIEQQAEEQNEKLEEEYEQEFEEQEPEYTM